MFAFFWYLFWLGVDIFFVVLLVSNLWVTNFSWQMWRQMNAWKIMVVVGRIRQLTSLHARYLCFSDNNYLIRGQLGFQFSLFLLIHVNIFSGYFPWASMWVPLGGWCAVQRRWLYNLRRLKTRNFSLCINFIRTLSIS